MSGLLMAWDMPSSRKVPYKCESKHDHLSDTQPYRWIPCSECREDLTPVDPKCQICEKRIRLNMPKLIWTCWNDKYYHHLCLETELDKAKKFEQIDRILHPPSSYYFSVCDVMECAECGGYTVGYGCLVCRHCGGKLQENGSRYRQSNNLD